MKTLMTASMAVAGFFALQADAYAQSQPVRASDRYCLESYSGDSGGGAMPLLCRFATMEQCIQSKTGNTDRCMLNPYLVRRGG